MNDLALTTLLLLAVLLLLAWHLRTLHPARQEAGRPERSPVRYQVRFPAFCPGCAAPTTDGELGRLHRELGRWRPGNFRRPCPRCGHPVLFSVREAANEQ